MAYDSDNLDCLVPSFDNTNNTPSIWTYHSTDAASVVDADGYISDGQLRGMKLGDLVLVTDTDATPPVITSHRVHSLSTSDDSVDLTDLGATLASTDSD